MSCLNVTINRAQNSPTITVGLASYSIKLFSSLVCDISIGDWEYFNTSDNMRFLCSDNAIFNVRRND